MKTFTLELTDGSKFLVDADRYRVTPTDMLEFIRNKTADKDEDIPLIVVKRRGRCIGTPHPVSQYQIPNPTKKGVAPAPLSGVESRSVGTGDFEVPQDDAGSP